MKNARKISCFAQTKNKIKVIKGNKQLITTDSQLITTFICQHEKYGVIRKNK